MQYSRAGASKKTGAVITLALKVKEERGMYGGHLGMCCDVQSKDPAALR